MANLNNELFKQILKDINNGVFDEPDFTTTQYYGEDEAVEVTASVGNHHNLLDFEVIVHDNDCDDCYICNEQYIELRDALEESLRYAREDAESEARFTQWLWNNCA